MEENKIIRVCYGYNANLDNPFMLWYNEHAPLLVNLLKTSRDNVLQCQLTFERCFHVILKAEHWAFKYSKQIMVEDNSYISELKYYMSADDILSIFNRYANAYKLADKHNNMFDVNFLTELSQ